MKPPAVKEMEVIWAKVPEPSWISTPVKVEPEPVFYDLPIPDVIQKINVSLGLKASEGMNVLPDDKTPAVRHPAKPENKEGEKNVPMAIQNQTTESPKDKNLRPTGNNGLGNGVDPPPASFEKAKPDGKAQGLQTENDASPKVAPEKKSEGKKSDAVLHDRRSR